MLTKHFSYRLPKSLIAKYPAKNRADSRLLYLHGISGDMQHSYFSNVISYLQPNDLLVINDSKVIRARLFGFKETGGRVEVMIERIESEQVALAYIRASKSPQPGTKIILDSDILSVTIEVLGRVNSSSLFQVRFVSSSNILQILEQVGHIPLPPYLKRHAELIDYERYQTVYAENLGSVAAPTAGLHFEHDLLTQIKHYGVNIAAVTLHVGAGTFQPIRVDNVDEHQMHTEHMIVTKDLCDQVATAKANGGRVIAVGTTALRALETASLSGTLQPYCGETDLFIKPGYNFQVVDTLITNFHLPESTLLMLVCAFGGVNNVLQAYQEAIKQKYRFYSYGDAMFIGKI